MIGRKFAALDVVEGCDYFDGATFVARLIRRVFDEFRLDNPPGLFDLRRGQERSEKEWPYSFCSYVEKKDDAIWPGHMPVPMVEILNEMQLRFRVHMCVG